MNGIPYKLIDLFSGAGGMTLGFVNRRFCGGFASILAIDNDEAAAKTHKQNFGGLSVCADIEEWIRRHPIPRADIVVGGPPCQGFSLLNKKRVGDHRRALWEPYLDIVEASKASVFVMENVTELLSSSEFTAIERRAKRMGFEISARILNSADFGVAQTRRRAIAIAWKSGLLRGSDFFPRPTHRDPNALGALPRWKTVRDAIADLPRQPIGTEIGDKPPLNLHFGRSPTAKSLQRYAVVPEGGNRFDLFRTAPEITPICWIKKTSGGTDLFGRLWWDRPSVTIRTEFFKPEKGRYLHPVEDRPITHREAARLMGFPDEFRFAGNKVEIAKQIGNAVPPPLAGAIALTIRATLDHAFKTRLTKGKTRGAALKTA